MKGLLSKMFSLEDKVGGLVAPFVLLATRIYVGCIFFKSGKLKLDSWLNDNWDLTVYLFTDEHPVPFLNPELAAYMATAGEITLPILLFLGIFTRVGAVGLLAMTAVIEFTYKALPEHDMWALMLLAIVAFGAGKFSIDNFIRKAFAKKS